MSLGGAAHAEARFEIPEGCGTAAEFRSELERLIGAAAEAALPVALAIVPGAERGYELRLELRGELRELQDPNCRTLFESAIVIAAAAWRGEPPSVPSLPAPEPTTDPSALPPPATPAPAPAPPPRSPPASARFVAPPRAPPSGPATPIGPQRGFGSGLTLGAGISGGIVPGVGAIVEVGAHLEPRPWGVSFAVRHWPERNASREGRSVDVSALGARAAALIRLAPSARLSVGLELARLSGTGGESVSKRDSDAAWQIAPSLGLGVIAWSVSHLRLELAAVGRVALVRPRFVVTGFGDVYQVPPFGADAILRGVWLFP